MKDNAGYGFTRIWDADLEERDVNGMGWDDEIVC